MAVIRQLSNSVCIIILVIKQIGPPATRSSDFVNHSYDYRSNWTPLSPITIIYKNQEYNRLFCFCFFSLFALQFLTCVAGVWKGGEGIGVSCLPCLKFPVPSLSNACHAGYAIPFPRSLCFHTLLFLPYFLAFFKYRMHAENVPFCLCSFKWLQLSVGSKMCLTTKLSNIYWPVAWQIRD